MKQAIITYGPHLLSIVSVWHLILTGNMDRRAWLIGLLSQALWLIWIVVSQQYGFLLMNAAYWVVCYRNHLKWQARIPAPSTFSPPDHFWKFRGGKKPLRSP